ncbi:MAG: acylphosphatase [Phycisphaerales bacterium]
MRRERLNFVGRVQGVGFRATARRIASALPITGWVRNEPDGSVLLEAQGPGPAIDDLVERIHASMGAKVRGVTRLRLPVHEEEIEFVIAD